MQLQCKSFTGIVHLLWEKPFLSVLQSLFTEDAFKNVEIVLLQEEILFLHLKYLKKWTWDSFHAMQSRLCVFWIEYLSQLQFFIFVFWLYTL